MGRGSSKANGGKSVTALNVNGDNIDLSDSPLIYGAKDSEVAGDVRRTIDEWESKRQKNKVEFMAVVNDNGAIIEERRGGKGSVKTSINALNNGKVLSHVHPRNEGVLGGTFSVDDLYNLSDYKINTYRAIAKEGAYSITKKKNFDKFLPEAYDAHARQADLPYLMDIKSAKDNYNSGKISYKEYRKAYRKAANNMLVERHNWLLANQEKFGYDYTLERR